MAANNSILFAKSVDAAKITYSAIKSLESGGKSIYLSYNGRPLIVQTPELKAPFGVSRWPSDRGQDKYVMELALAGHDGDRPGVKAFHDMLAALDAKIVQDALDNSLAWFKKKYNSTEVVQALYTPMLRLYKDRETGEVSDKYPPQFKTTLPHRDNVFSCDAYDSDRAKLDLSTVLDGMKGARVTAIVQCNGIWIAGGKFGCTWKVLQLMVQLSSSIRGFAFQDDGESSMGGGGGSRSSAAAAAPPKYLKGSDDDDEADDAVPPPPPAAKAKPAPAPAPTPKPKPAPPPPVVEEDLIDDEDDVPPMPAAAAAAAADEDDEEEALEEEEEEIDEPPPPPPPKPAAKKAAAAKKA
jgi:hypothetical protein